MAKHRLKIAISLDFDLSPDKPHAIHFTESYLEGAAEGMTWILRQQLASELMRGYQKMGVTAREVKNYVEVHIERGLKIEKEITEG